jgi:hypothetical protein
MKKCRKVPSNTNKISIKRKRRKKVAKTPPKSILIVPIGR